MVPILGGLGAALLFTVSVLASARSSRLIGSESTVAWAMTIGLAVTLPVAVATVPSPDFGGGTWAWFLAAGLGNVVGLLLTYAAYRIGAVAVIVTIASTEGAIAAVLAVLFGEALAPGTGLILAIVAVGVVVTATGSGSGAEGRQITRDQAIRAALLAIGLGGLLRDRPLLVGPAEHAAARALGDPGTAGHRLRAASPCPWS